MWNVGEVPRFRTTSLAQSWAAFAEESAVPPPRVLEACFEPPTVTVMDNVDSHPADDTLKFYVWYEWIEVHVARKS